MQRHSRFYNRMIRLTMIVFLLVNAHILMGQEFFAPEKEWVKNETDTIRLFFEADSIDIFIQEISCWGEDYATVINIRKLSGTYKIRYRGGKPVKSIHKAYTSFEVSKIKEVLLALPAQMIPSGSSPYFEVYVQTVDARSKYTHLTLGDYKEESDKKIRKILGIKN